MIPKIIHQTWKTNIIPEKFENWHEKVKQLHPKWEIILWTDEDNVNLVKRYFPNLLKIYNSLQYNIMRADIIRYMYMAIYGGYYLDLDYELFVPFEKTASYSEELILPISRISNTGTILGNSIFGSIPGHVFWKDVLNEFQANPPVKKFYDKFQVLKLTGPDFISEVYFKSSAKYIGSLVEKNIFHPDETFTNMQNYQEILMQNGSMGIHHCQGSWINQNGSLLNYISKGLGSVKRRLNK